MQRNSGICAAASQGVGGAYGETGPGSLSEGASASRKMVPDLWHGVPLFAISPKLVCEVTSSWPSFVLEGQKVSLGMNTPLACASSPFFLALARVMLEL